jgi:hypothetical protein
MPSPEGQTRNERDHPVASHQVAELVILMPVFNDWIAAAKLLTHLDSVLRETELRADVVVVDDGSTNSPADEDMGCRSFSGVRQVHVVHLRRSRPPTRHCDRPHIRSRSPQM